MALTSAVFVRRPPYPHTTTTPGAVNGREGRARVFDVDAHWCLCVCAGLRGVSPNVIILEEAAFVDPDLFFHVIVPLMGVDGTCVLGISTPNTADDNYYNMLMDIPHPTRRDDTLFKSIRLTLACPQCVLDGKAADCLHMAHLMPSWKSRESLDKVKLIMQGQGTLFDVENLGRTQSDAHYVFNRDWVRTLQAAPLYRWPRPPDLLFMAIDPSGGGTQSDYALATVGIRDGCYVVAGLDHSPSADSLVVRDMIHRHLLGLRDARSPYRDSHLFVFVEANMSWLHADEVRQMLESDSRYGPLRIESSDRSGRQRPGVITTENNKQGFVHCLRHPLMLGHLRHAEYAVSQDIQAARTVLHDQIRHFRRNVKEAANPEYGQAARVAYTGKTHTRKDDLVLALMMAMFWGGTALDMYREEFTRRGWQFG